MRVVSLLWSFSTQSLFWGPGAWASPGSLLEMQSFRRRPPRPAESGLAFQQGPQVLHMHAEKPCFSGPVGSLTCMGWSQQELASFNGDPKVTGAGVSIRACYSISHSWVYEVGALSTVMELVSFVWVCECLFTDTSLFQRDSHTVTRHVSWGAGSLALVEKSKDTSQHTWRKYTAWPWLQMQSSFVAWPCRPGFEPCTLLFSNFFFNQMNSI